MEQLRAEIEIGVRELDSSLGEDLDIEEVIRQAHEEPVAGIVRVFPKKEL